MNILVTLIASAIVGTACYSVRSPHQTKRMALKEASVMSGAFGVMFACIGFFAASTPQEPFLNGWLVPAIAVIGVSIALHRRASGKARAL